MPPPPPPSTLFPYTTLFRSNPCWSRQAAQPFPPASWSKSPPPSNPSSSSPQAKPTSSRLIRRRRGFRPRSEEHTSELQSRPHLVCRLLLEKKKRLHAEFPLP